MCVDKWGKCAGSSKEVHVPIRKTRLEKLVRAAGQKKYVSSREMMECINLICAELEENGKSSENAGDTNTHISLESALEDLEYISLDKKALNYTTYKSNTDSHVTAGFLG